MADIGRLKKCVYEYSGGMTGGSYSAVVRRSRSGAVVSIRDQEFHGAKPKKVRREITDAEFSELEKALSEFDFEKKASDELIAERSELIALDAPDESMKVIYEKASYSLSGDDLAPENTPARSVIIGFFDDIYYSEIKD